MALERLIEIDRERLGREAVTWEEVTSVSERG
jgi:hypothetical protein